MTTILAWHGDPALRDAAVTRMRDHAQADALIQGAYLTIDEDAPGGYRGCFYGCLVAELAPEVFTDADPDEDGLVYDEDGAPREPAGGWANGTARLLGLPARFGRLAEALFEALPAAEAPEFAVAITEAIAPGADLLRVVDRWLIALLTDPDRGVRRVAGSHGLPIIDDVAALLARSADGTPPDREEWTVARGAASRQLDKRPDEAKMPDDEWTVWYRGRNAIRAAQYAAEPLWEVSAVCESAAEAVADDSSRAAVYVAYRWQANQLIRLTADAAPAEVTG